MKVIKRNGEEVQFNPENIINAIKKANSTVNSSFRIDEDEIISTANHIYRKCTLLNRAPSVEEIQDMVEYNLMKLGYFDVAKNYITYRYNRELLRKRNTTDEKILSLVNCANENIKQENSNKDPVINSTQRDYIAGETSKDLTERLLLPPEKLIKMVLFISMIQIILLKECITVV